MIAEEHIERNWIADSLTSRIVLPLYVCIIHTKIDAIIIILVLG